MDRILKGYLKDFVDNFKLDKMRDTEAFERFVNYSVLSRITNLEFELDNICVGGSNDMGVDGVAILVNEHVVNSVEEIDYFKNVLKRFDVKFVFIQSKSSCNFKSNEVGNFLFGSISVLQK